MGKSDVGGQLAGIGRALQAGSNHTHMSAREEAEKEVRTMIDELKEAVSWGNPSLFQKVNWKYKYFTRADLDSFLFLFLDNLSSLLGILAAFIEIGTIAWGCFGPRG